MTRLVKYSTLSDEKELTEEDVVRILDEAEECLNNATKKENMGDYEEAIEIRAAKTIFTHYYGPLLIGLVGSALTGGIKQPAF